ncbi:MAG: YvcK family protein [Bacilli bacterium]|nr:YvcK family protein [Bacilli bacterium]MBQ3468458.1 YvcK family protein [Bacilli bacterium]
MQKKVVVFGGGTGLSSLLKGLKEYPLDITAVITVSDNGRSTGKLRKEFNVPAVGDIRKVITSLSTSSDSIKEMMEYRFHTSSDLDGHAVGNLVLTSLLDITGSLKDAIASLCELFNVRHTVLPISEDSDLTLMAKFPNGEIVEGEENISEKGEVIEKIFYKEEPNVLKEVIDAINEADLIIFSMGSLYTSILPNIICKDVEKALNNSKAPIMYVCNAMTQPGETDKFKVSDHVKLLNSYLDKRKIDIVIASNTKISKKIAKKYETEEQKDAVLVDHKNLDNMDVKLIESDLLIVENNVLRHDGFKIGSIVVSYLIGD